MARCRLATALFLLLHLFLLPLTWAQLKSGDIKVRVTLADGHPCNIVVHVQLMPSSSNNPVADAYTNDACMTEFNNLETGNYHLVVSGQGIEETDSEMFEVDNRRTGQYQYVSVKRTKSDDHTNSNLSGTPTVGASDLNIPQNAAKEFDKASEFMAKQDWKKAIERLNKALAIYPKYAAAYNNLGVVYAHMDDRPREREALQKAVGLNDHLAAAFVNLAKMAIADHDMPQAETLLDKATAADPDNSQTLILLANVQLLDLKYDQAIATSRKIHLLAKDSHALCHYISARAFEHENRPADAVAEFQTFLQEEPVGDRAEAVRKELAGLQIQSR
jgi:tetratricopeptide (TPR) repeat protein